MHRLQDVLPWRLAWRCVPTLCPQQWVGFPPPPLGFSTAIKLLSRNELRWGSWPAIIVWTSLRIASKVATLVSAAARICSYVQPDGPPALPLVSAPKTPPRVAKLQKSA
jgi:hypothetical protein